MAISNLICVSSHISHWFASESFPQFLTMPDNRAWGIGIMREFDVLTCSLQSCGWPWWYVKRIVNQHNSISEWITDEPDSLVFSNSMLASWGHRSCVLCNSWHPLQIEQPFNVSTWSRTRYDSTWKLSIELLDCKDNCLIVCTLLTRQQFDRHNSVELTTRINLSYFLTSEVSFDPYLSACIDSQHLPGFGGRECFQSYGIHVEIVCTADIDARQAGTLETPFDANAKLAFDTFNPENNTIIFP
jgi:hypothetical protein